MTRRLQAAALIELVLILGLAAALAIEAQHFGAGASKTSSQSQSMTTTPMSTSQMTSSTETTTGTSVSTQGPPPWTLGNSSYYPSGVVFQSPAHLMPIFLANASSSDTIYVVYQINGTQPISLGTQVDAAATRDVGDSPWVVNSGNRSSDISIVPSQSSISPGGGIVSFSVTVSANASGLYAVFIPNIMCAPVYFAVAYSPSQITSPSFPYPDEDCIWGATVPVPQLEINRGYIVGLEGISVAFASDVPGD